MVDLKKLSEPPADVPLRKPRPSRAKDPANPSKGGRKVGSLNKRTIAKIEEAKGAKQLPKKSLGYLRETARYITGAMAIKQPWNADGTKREGGDYKVFIELCELQLKYLMAITPYEDPRLSAVALMPQNNGMQRAMVNVTILNERGEKVFSDVPKDQQVLDIEATEITEVSSDDEAA